MGPSTLALFFDDFLEVSCDTDFDVLVAFSDSFRGVLVAESPKRRGPWADCAFL